MARAAISLTRPAQSMRIQPTKPQPANSDAAFNLFCETTFYVMFSYLTLDSLLRFLLQKVHLAPLVYFYMPFTFIAGFWWLGRMVRAHTELVLFLGMLALFHIGVGLYVMGDYRQVGMGVRLMTNLLLTGAIAPYVFSASPRTQRFLLCIFLVNFAGLMINQFLGKMPWNEVTIDVGGMQISGSGVELGGDGSYRAAGFARTNHVAAAISSVLPLLLATHTRRRWFGVVLLMMGFVGVLATQQKALVALYAVAALPVAMMPEQLRGMVLRGLTVFFGGLCMGLPVVLHGIHYEMKSMSSPLYSLLDRINYTWPMTWRLIVRKGAMWGFLGRGIGGVGSPQGTFAAADFRAVDNFFIYCYGWFGIFSIPYLVILIGIVVRSRRNDPVALGATVAMAFSLAFGITSSIMEEPISTFSLFGPVFVLGAMQARQRKPLAS